MNDKGIQIRVGDVIHVIWKKKLLILLMTVAGFAVGFMFFGLSHMLGGVSRDYRIHSSVSMLTMHEDGTFLGGDGTSDKDFTLSKDMIESTLFVLKSDSVLQSVLEEIELPGIKAKDLRKNISVKQYESTPIVEIDLFWRDGQEGVLLMKSLIRNAGSEIREAFRVGTLYTLEDPKSGAGSLLDRSGVTAWILMAVLGFIAGVGITLLELILRPTLMYAEDVESLLGVELFGTVPKAGRAMAGEAFTGIGLSQYYAAPTYILKNRLGIRQEGENREGACFYVTSAVSGEGKTSAAANLAQNLSLLGHKVLLVDRNLHSPKLAAAFGLTVDYNHSLNAFCSGAIGWEEAVITVNDCLDLLPSVLEYHSYAKDLSALLQLRELKTKYEFILIDTAPVCEDSGILSLNAIADSALFVVQYDSTPMQKIRKGLSLLDKSGVRILGCIVNQVDTSSQDRKKPDGD